MANKLIKAIAPEWALKRETARARLNALEVMNSGYSRHAASVEKNSFRGWFSKAGSPKEDITKNLPKLRERSRDLFMGSPLATSAIKTIRTNVVGAGLQLNATPNAEILGLTPEQRREWQRKTEHEFKMWADSTACDLERTKTFGTIQSLVLVSCLMNGDVFAMMPIVPRVGSAYDMRIQLIESDLIRTPFEMQFNDSIQGGIETDEYGAPTAAYIHKAYESDVLSNTGYSKIPFYGEKTGRRVLLQVIQDYERVGQVRGVPILAPVVESLKQLTRYSDAELMASVIASMLTVFVKSSTPDSPLGASMSMEQQVTDDDDSYELGNGSVVSLADGEDVSIVNPARSNTSFEPFVNAVVRQIGAALEVPHELLVKHFTASYSASRAALLEAWKTFKMRRQWLVDSFCQPVYEEWLAEAVAKGRIAAPGFFTDPSIRAAWCNAQWFGPTQGQLNPLQEAKANTENINNGTTTRRQVSSEMGNQDWEETATQLIREHQTLKEGGVINEQMARNQSGDSNQTD